MQISMECKMQKTQRCQVRRGSGEYSKKKKRCCKLNLVGELGCAVSPPNGGQGQSAGKI